MPTSCSRCSSLGVEGSGVTVHCGLHGGEGMVDVKALEGWSKQPTSDAEGSFVAVYCKQDGEKDMISVKRRVCAREGCSIRTTLSVEGKGVVSSRRRPKRDAVDVCSNHALCPFPHHENDLARRDKPGIKTMRPAMSLSQAKHAVSGALGYRGKRCTSASDGALEDDPSNQRGRKIYRATGALTSPRNMETTSAEDGHGRTGLCDMKVETSF